MKAALTNALDTEVGGKRKSRQLLLLFSLGLLNEANQNPADFALEEEECRWKLQPWAGVGLGEGPQPGDGRGVEGDRQAP